MKTLAQPISLLVVGSGVVEFDSQAPYYCVPELQAPVRGEVRLGAKSGDPGGNECPYYLRGRR